MSSVSASSPIRPRSWGDDLDKHTTVSELRALVHQFVSARDWQPYHSPKNLSASIAIEAAELVEIFQWMTCEDSRQAASDPVVYEHARQELADVMIYCLSLANALDMDLGQAIYDKMKLNQIKYPVSRTRGRLGDR